jgi:hypothetical protein
MPDSSTPQDRPDAMELWEQAGGGTPDFDAERWHALIRERILGEGSEFPGPDEANWGLLTELAGWPHPLVNNEWQPPDVEDPGHATEMFHEMCNVHHLLDLVGVPHGYSIDTRDIDCRTLLVVRGMMTLRERLARISDWHARETGPAGTVGDYCTECGHRWPCDSRRMADGVYADEDDDA